MHSLLIYCYGANAAKKPLAYYEWYDLLVVSCCCLTYT